MKKIYEPVKVVGQILPKQNFDKNKSYRRFFYLTECPRDNGIILLNTLTYELLFLTDDEIGLLDKPDYNNPIVRHLIEGYFLVPEDFDDKKLGLQVMNTRLQVQSIFTNPPLRYFVILPTTACNARCFYCFEEGAKVSHMTEQTAHDVADFIERKGDKKVTLQWFGGEPLVNLKAIDTVTKDLTDKNVDFSSIMVSNGYLLDEDIIKRAVDQWRLKRIQITLDGTEEVYNRIKNYVYKDVGSPFIKVLENIENCLKAGIQINIRLNMDEHNADDLFELSKLLVQRFNKFNNCYIYVVRLFEDVCSKIKKKNVTERHSLIESSIKAQNFIDDNMPRIEIPDLPKSFGNPNTCMACSDTATMIVPDGHLGKCEHYVDRNFYGSIYSDKIDFPKFQAYKERSTVSKACDDCKFRSLCLHVKSCTGVPNHCDDMDKMATKVRLDSKLINIYTAFLKKEKGE